MSSSQLEFAPKKLLVSIYIPLHNIFVPQAVPDPVNQRYNERVDIIIGSSDLDHSKYALINLVTTTQEKMSELYNHPPTEEAAFIRMQKNTEHLFMAECGKYPSRMNERIYQLDNLVLEFKVFRPIPLPSLSNSINDLYTLGRFSAKYQGYFECQFDFMMMDMNEWFLSDIRSRVEKKLRNARDIFDSKVQMERETALIAFFRELNVIASEEIIRLRSV